MSFFFGTPKPKEVDLATSVQQVRDTIAAHEKRNALLQSDVARLTKEARATTDKSRQILLLRRIKQLKTQQTQNENVILQLEKQQLLLENSALTKEAMQSLKTTSSKMHALGFDVAEAEHVMDDLEEHHVAAREVGDVLGNVLGTDEIDEDELLREFAALDGPSGGEKEHLPVEIAPLPAFPPVPTTSLSTAAKTRQSPPSDGGPPAPPPTLVDKPRRKADTSKLKALFE